MIAQSASLCHKAPNFSVYKENNDHINAMEDKDTEYSSDNAMERLNCTISEPAAEGHQENIYIHSGSPHCQHNHHHHDNPGSRGGSPEPYMVPVVYYPPMSPYYHPPPHQHHPPASPLPYHHMMYGSSPPAMPYHHTYPIPYPPPPHHQYQHHQQQEQQQQLQQQQSQEYNMPPVRIAGGSPPPPPPPPLHHLRSSYSAGDETMMAKVYGGSDSSCSPNGNDSGPFEKKKDRASARIARSQRAGGSYNPDQFVFNMEEALSGSPSARTTIMLKNIPNKYNQAQLMTMVEEGFKESGSIDFFYLPVDFRTRCNLGYAFINFIDAAATAKFYEQFHGKKWEEDSDAAGRQMNGNGDALSKKVAQITYGRVQGKDALVNHFKGARFPNDDVQWMPLVFEAVVDGNDNNMNGQELKPEDIRLCEKKY